MAFATPSLMPHFSRFVFVTKRSSPPAGLPVPEPWSASSIPPSHLPAVHLQWKQSGIPLSVLYNKHHFRSASGHLPPPVSGFLREIHKSPSLPSRAAGRCIQSNPHLLAGLIARPLCRSHNQTQDIPGSSKRSGAKPPSSPTAVDIPSSFKIIFNQ